jgi:hypothetical protein
LSDIEAFHQDNGAETPAILMPRIPLREAAAQYMTNEKIKMASRRDRASIGIDKRKIACDLGDIPRPHKSRKLFAITQENQRRPQLHGKRAAQATPLAIFDPQMTHGRMRRECCGDQRLCRTAMTTPAGAEFDKRLARQPIDLCARRLDFFKSLLC